MSCLWHFNALGAPGLSNCSHRASVSLSFLFQKQSSEKGPPKPVTYLCLCRWPFLVLREEGCSCRVRSTRNVAGISGMKFCQEHTLTGTLGKPTMSPGVRSLVIPAKAQSYHCCLDLPKTTCITKYQAPPALQNIGVRTGAWVDFWHILSQCSQGKLVQGCFYQYFSGYTLTIKEVPSSSTLGYISENQS